MANVASALKAEISRIARKEIRSDVAALRKSAATHRRDIASLKTRVADLERFVRRLGTPARGVKLDPTDGPVSVQRSSAKGMVAQRKRIGLSAAELGILFGTSGQTIYNWEQGRARPRASHMAAIAALKTLGKRAAREVLESRSKSRRVNRSSAGTMPQLHRELAPSTPRSVLQEADYLAVR